MELSIGIAAGLISGILLAMMALFGPQALSDWLQIRKVERTLSKIQQPPAEWEQRQETKSPMEEPPERNPYFDFLPSLEGELPITPQTSRPLETLPAYAPRKIAAERAEKEYHHSLGYSTEEWQVIKLDIKSGKDPVTQQ